MNYKQKHIKKNHLSSLITPHILSSIDTIQNTDTNYINNNTKLINLTRRLYFYENDQKVGSILYSKISFKFINFVFRHQKTNKMN